LKAIAVFVCLLFSSRIGEATSYYVAPSGLDTNPGTLAQPWRTIQKAADSLEPGNTAYVRAGTYAKVAVNVSGSADGGYITFCNYPNETPIIDATGVAPPTGDTALFLLTDKSYVIIQGFELRNYKTSRTAEVPAGIFLRGACQHVQIRGCNIHNIWNTGGTKSDSGNAFGIAVYGSSATPATDIKINGNNVHDLKTGASESIAINGNVTNAQVTNNTVHDTNNIGIDFIGFEGTAPTPDLDQARDGKCSGNVVFDISSQGNQAYSNGDYSADGLYCDGSTRITLERNIVHDTDIGIELASEHSGKLTTAITVRNNFFSSNRQTGLLLGGYARNGTGGTDGCVITGNTFFENDTLHWGNGEARLRFRTSNCVIQGNVFYSGPDNLFITVPAANNVNDTFNCNLYAVGFGTEVAYHSPF
jgi:Right handed beta helix region